MTLPLLEVTGLAVGYGDVQVVWSVDLAVAGGSVVALIGSNGAGKTTILRALSGLLRPAGGNIVFAGETVRAASPQDFVRRGVIHVPEGRRLFPSLSVLDNLMLGAYLRGDRAGIARDIERVFTLFPRLCERRRQDVSTLSGGEQRSDRRSPNQSLQVGGRPHMNRALLRSRLRRVGKCLLLTNVIRSA